MREIGILQQLACFCLPFHLLPLHPSITSAGRVFEFGANRKCSRFPGWFSGQPELSIIEDGFDNVVIISV
jgi:hypothetical protein